MNEKVNRYIVHAFNVNALLSRFFHSPLEFRVVMARTTSLVSGPTALHLFDRSTDKLTTLHVYVSGWRNTVELSTFLLAQGYVFQPAPFHAKHLDPRTGFLDVNQLKRAYPIPCKDGVTDVLPLAPFPQSGISFTRHLAFTFLSEQGDTCIRIVSGIASAVQEILRSDASE